MTALLIGIPSSRGALYRDEESANGQKKDGEDSKDHWPMGTTP